MFTSTRSRIEASSAEAILRGLAPDRGLYVPGGDIPRIPMPADLREAENAALAAFFGDIPQSVRDAAVDRLLSRFPAGDPVPLAGSGAVRFLELFHGPTGAFKDVALSMLPVLLAHSAAQAGAKRVLVLTATSGDTGSAAMAGFAGSEGASVAVFYPSTGTSRIQRLQMVSRNGPGARAFAVAGDFDDAQSAVKRIFASDTMRAEAAAAGVTLSSANSINIGRLVPQIAYWLAAGARIGGGFDAAVPSGNFGDILAAYIAKRMGAPIGTLVCASNENRVLERFIATGVYDPRPELKVTNSPSMDIRVSSNVERLLWMLCGRDPGTVSALLGALGKDGFYTLPGAAFKALREDFACGWATQEETVAEMRRLRDETGYMADPHTAVASAAARKAGFPSGGRPLVVAATATPHKFPETCAAAFGEGALPPPPPSVAGLDRFDAAPAAPVAPQDIEAAVRSLFAAP